MKFVLLLSAVLGLSQAFLPIPKFGQQKTNNKTKTNTRTQSNTRLSQNSAIGNQNTLAG
jgi:hypothetical protein